MARFIPSRLVVASDIIALLFSHFVSSHGSAAAAQNEPTQQIPGMPEPEPEGTDPVACFETDPKPPVVDINDAVRFNASCSTADEPLRVNGRQDRNLPLALPRW